MHVNTNGDCDDPANPPLAGVTIQLLNSTGSVIDTTQTDANGEYNFDNLPPGTYGVHEIQPAGYFDGETEHGSAGGNVSNNLVTQIVLISGVDAVHYDFCEIPPAQLCGFVYVDMNNNGLKEAGEAGIANVTVELLDANGQPTGVTAVTDATGEYCFVGLRPARMACASFSRPDTSTVWTRRATRAARPSIRAIDHRRRAQRRPCTQRITTSANCCRSASRARCTSTPTATATTRPIRRWPA